MNLSSINMNLLNALHALLTEESVTKAAEQLALSQPQVSNMLKELRNIFDDELLVRGPSNRLMLTQKGESLILPVSEAIEKCKLVFRNEKKFDPKEASVNFRIGLNEFASGLIIPDLTKNIIQTSDQISLTVKNTNDVSSYGLMYADSLDLFVGFTQEDAGHVCSELLFENKLTCLISNKHPLAKKNKLSNNDMLSNPFIQIQQTKQFWTHEEKYIEKMLPGKKRVVCKLPHIITIMDMISSNNFLCIAHEKLAQKYSKTFDIKTIELPFEIKIPPYYMHWKKVDDSNKENQWLRKQVRKVVKAIDAKR